MEDAALEHGVCASFVAQQSVSTLRLSPNSSCNSDLRANSVVAGTYASVSRLEELGRVLVTMIVIYPFHSKQPVGEGTLQLSV